jgi:hypothetical protein
MALGRSPTAEETRDGLQFVKRYRGQLQEAPVPTSEQDAQAWAALARTLLVRNEFLFVD